MNQVTISLDELPEEAVKAMEDAQRTPLLLGIGAFLLFCAVGLFFLLKPDLVWEIQHLLSVDGGEPTEFYLICTRISGIILIIMGIVCLVLTILSQ